MNLLKSNDNRGITLIALVITIIILLILAGVSIATLTGENGILQKATMARKETEKAEVIEISRTDILEMQSGNEGNLTRNQFKEVLDRYFDDVPSNFTGETIVKSKEDYGKHDIKVSEIWDGTIKEEETEDDKYSELKVGDYVNYPVNYDNVATWVEYSSGGIKGNTPRDEYKGWRILSKDVQGGETYIRLVSAGVPIDYRHGFGADTTIENLTTKFFNTSIETSVVDYAFYNSGFKTNAGDIVTDMAKVKELFSNEFTAKYASGESAEYTDDALDKTFTNSEVEGYPKVQAMTKRDAEAVMKGSLNEGDLLISEDLLAIPCKETSNEYAMNWIVSGISGSSSDICMVGYTGKIGKMFQNICGVRPVVTLNSKVKFTPAENNINDVQTWNISN